MPRITKVNYKGTEYDVGAIDATLTQSGQAADSKAVGDKIEVVEDEITDLKNEINVSITIVEGYSIRSDTGAIITNLSDAYIEIPVLYGMRLTGFTRGGLDKYHGYAFYKADGTFISGGDQVGAGRYNWNYDVTAPEGAYIFRITCIKSDLSRFTYNVYGSVNSSILALRINEQANDILPDYNTLNKTVVNGKSINSDTGNTRIIAEDSYVEIPVVPGLKISGYTRGGLDANHGYAFYDSDGVFISGGNNIGAGTYNWNYDVTVPSGAYIFRISCATSYISSFTAKYSDIFRNTVEAISIIPRKTVLYCGANRTLNTLKKGIEEATKHMDAVLYVEPGTYDLVQEFGSEWFDALVSTDVMSGLVLKNRVHVIFSPNSKVISHYTGSNEFAQKLYSPFNAGEYGFTVENLTLECSNCRYAVHDERNGATEQYKAEYINCNLHIDNSGNTYWTNSTCIGGGLGSNSEIIIKDCIFKGADAESRAGVYYHQSNKSSDTNYKSKVIVNGNFFVTGCVQIDDSRSDSTGNGKTEYLVTNNCFPVKYPGTNDEGIHVANMTNPASVLYAWNNNIRSN